MTLDIAYDRERINTHLTNSAVHAPSGLNGVHTPSGLNGVHSPPGLNLAHPAPGLKQAVRLEDARRIFAQQAAAISGLRDRIDANFSRAVDRILSTEGHVVVSGMGKSGLIGQKMAATFASTGTPSFFVHPADAYHGDLGMIGRNDVMMLLSHSGETEEVVRLLPWLNRMGVPTIALVGKPGSTLGEHAEIAINVSVDREACPHNLAPTNSALTTLAMGDALAIALMIERNFQPADFARFHPGGSLARRLLSVKDVMHRGTLPRVSPEQTVGQSLLTITRGRLGLVLVFRTDRQRGDVLAGIVTDGDLRRAMQRHNDLLSIPVSRIMTSEPITISEDAPISEAYELMRKRKIGALIATDDAGKVTGVLDLFDLGTT